MAIADDIKERSYNWLIHLETAAYIALGVLIGGAALLSIVGAVPLLIGSARELTGSSTIFLLIDRLLLVLVLVELLHTVRISIRSHTLVIEPFLVIGLIAVIRRVLVLTLQAEGFTKNTPWNPDVESHFRASMIEAGVLSLLLVVFVISIAVIRRMKSEEEHASMLVDPRQ